MGDPGYIVTGVLVQPDCHYLLSPDSSSCLRAEALNKHQLICVRVPLVLSDARRMQPLVVFSALRLVPFPR